MGTKKPTNTAFARFGGLSMYLGQKRFVRTAPVRKLASKMLQWCDYSDELNGRMKPRLEDILGWEDLEFPEAKRVGGESGAK